MTSEEQLLQYFTTLGHTVNDKSIIKKCLDLCEKHGISEEILVDEWFDYIMSLEDNANAAPAIDNLTGLDSFLTKKQLKENSDSDNDDDNTLVNEQPKQKTDLSRLAIFNSIKQFDDNDEDDVLGMYGVKKPVASPSIKEHQESGDGDITMQQDNHPMSPRTDNSVSPATYTSQTQSPRLQRGTVISGKVLERIGKNLQSWVNQNKRDVEVTKTSDPHVPVDVTYMLDRLANHVAVIQDRGLEFSEQLMETWKTIDKNEVMSTLNVNEPTQGVFRTYGRISCDEDGKLNSESTLLEGFVSPKQFESDCLPGDYDDNEAVDGTIHLDLTRLPKYSIFPGQIVSVECTNPTLDLLVATKMLSIARPPALSTPKLKEEIKIFVASGPFTLADTFEFDPLTKLMEHVSKNEPNVLILIGPLIDERHPVVQESGLVDTFQEVFENIVEKIMAYVKSKCTKVVLVASCYDAHHHNVYPTPEYDIPESFSRYSNLVVMPDPCMLDIEGLIVGATSVDIIKHLVAEEISSKTQGAEGRVGRLADHVLAQSCFYPLNPPSSEVNVDIGLWRSYAMMHQLPHILFLPSTMRYFSRWTGGCLIINPEKLVKGTYARLNIRPSDDEKWRPDSVDCEILKT